MFSFDCARMPICVYDADALKLSGGCDCSPMVIWNFCDTCSKQKHSCVVKLKHSCFLSRSKVRVMQSSYTLFYKTYLSLLSHTCLAN